MPSQPTLNRLYLVRYGLSLGLIALVLLILWPGLLPNLLASGYGEYSFMPHGHCYLWVPSLVALHVSTDLLIGVSYSLISLTLGYMVYRARRDIPFHWMFIAFGLFIIACGATHFMEVWTLWNATYWLSGYFKLVTASASVATAAVLPFVVPSTLRLVKDAKVAKVNRSELERLNADLEKEIQARKQAESQLRETMLTLQAIFRASPLAIFAVDTEGKVLTWNPSAERMFGRSESDALGQPLAVDEFQVTFQRVLMGQSFADLELISRTKNDLELDLSMSTAPLRDASGNITGALAVTADVTERKRAQKAEKSSEQKYRKIFDNATMGIYEALANGTITTVNSALVRMLGYDSEKELIGKNLFLDVYGFPEISDLQSEYLNILRKTTDLEIKWKKKSGQSVWVNLNSRAVYDADGTPLAFDGFVSDISERKRAEVALNTERHLIRTVFEQLPVGILIGDLEGNTTLANQTVCRLFGMPEERLTGLKSSDMFSLVQAETSDGVKLQADEIPSNEALRIRSGTAVREMQVTAVKGEKRSASATAVPLLDSENEPFGTVTVISDVTERLLLEDQLRQAQKMESIGTLAGGVAHDFNNLLTVIQGYNQLVMVRHAQDPKTAMFLSEVEKAANRATSLTRQLLAFSRRQRLEMKTLYLNEIARDMSRMLQRIIGEDIAIRIVESPPIAPVRVDPSQMEQVILNLAVNARDAMPNGGEVVIEIRNVVLDEAYTTEHPYAKAGRYVQLTISDTGIGMDEETKQRIFEPFFTTKEVGRGTGLGLSMVYGIVKQHDGLIEVHSEVDHGTIFKICLPAMAEQSGSEVQESLPPLVGGRETILVAEDEEALRGLVQTTLEDFGYTVLVAKDGLEAISLYEQNREAVSLVLFDMVMPRMGGREAYERILGMGHEVPVPALFMTGYSLETVQNQFLKQNEFFEKTGFDLIQKPYSFQSLGRKIREVLDKSHGQMI